MTPGSVAMLLAETTGLRVQTTAPSLGAANVRVNGLRGRYTQLLADGLPLYGNQGDSFSLLQVPPLDLSRGQGPYIQGNVEVELVCEPVFDYGRDARRVGARRRRPPHGRRDAGDGVPIRLRTDMALGIEGNRVRARHVLREGERAVLRALVGEADLVSPADVDDAKARLEATTRFWRNWLQPRAGARPPLARADPALGADHQGPDLHADRGDRRRADDVAARDPGRRAQLGLPLHVDARLDVHAPGAALARPRLGGRRVHAVRRRRRAQRATARSRSCTGSTAAAT